MKPLRIFGLPSHQSESRTSGVDFARIIQPLNHLNGFDGIETTLFDITKTTDWLYVAQNFDIIYFNYLNNPWGFAAMGAMARAHGVKIVMDIDDDLWDVHADNSAHSVYNKKSEGLKNFTLICNEVDLITTTNNYLKNVILHNTTKSSDKVKVLPNYIDLDLYNHKSSFKDDGTIQLTHYGSTTHFNDLNSEEFFRGVSLVMADYPNVSFQTVGAFMPKFRERWGSRYKNVYGHVDIYQWVKTKFPVFMDQTDILLTPLTDDVYNRCKSGIKFLEGSSAGKPGVWQKIRQYEEVVSGGSGLLAGTAEDWYEQIKKLIDDKVFRQKIGESAFKRVKDSWQIQNNIKYYANVFRKLTA